MCNMSVRPFVRSSVRSFVRPSSVRSGRHGGYIHPTISPLIHVNLVILVIHVIHVMVMMIMMIMMVMMMLLLLLLMMMMILCDVGSVFGRSKE